MRPIPRTPAVGSLPPLLPPLLVPLLVALLVALVVPLLLPQLAAPAYGRVIRVRPAETALADGAGGDEAGAPPSTARLLSDDLDLSGACDSVWIGSVLFKLCLSGRTFTFGNTIHMTYRVTNHGNDPVTWEFPTDCQDWWAIYPDSCAMLDHRCTAIWEKTMNCEFIYTYITLDPGEAVSFDFDWSQHAKGGYRARPDSYIACAAFANDLFDESRVFSRFTLRPYGPEPIQEALDRAVSGDTVLVAPGVYHENLNMLAAQGGVTLMAEQGPSETILDGSGRGSVLYFCGGHCAVEGFTICGGQEGDGDGATVAGGISVLDYSRVHIRRNVIRDNHGENGGGVSRSYDGWWDVTGNLFLRNEANRNGGGIYCSHRGYSNPGGVYRNTLVANRARRCGGGFYDCGSYQTSLVAYQNIFYQNEAGAAGGGFFCGGYLGDPLRRCNDYWENAPDDESGCNAEDHPLLQDPQFCAPEAEDFSLRSTSPCAEENSPECHAIGAYGVGCRVAASALTEESVKSLHIFPNPTSGSVIVSFAGPFSDALRLEVFSASGALVWSAAGKEVGPTLVWTGIDLNSRPVPKGVYFVRLRNETGLIGRGTIVRTR
jgi:hypothetical protein